MSLTASSLGLSNLGLSWRGCVESRPAPFDISDAPPVSGTGASLFVPFFGVNCAGQFSRGSEADFIVLDWRATPMWRPVRALSRM